METVGSRLTMSKGRLWTDPALSRRKASTAARRPMGIERELRNSTFSGTRLKKFRGGQGR